eukprot:1981604-Rhodomonas_salina.1
MEALNGAIYLPHQLEEMVRVCVIPTFRYSASLVPWTDTDLRGISDKFGITMKNAMKVNKGCANAVIQLPQAMGGWNTPNAEELYFRELWGVYQQCMTRDDAVKGMLAWELTELMKEYCTTTAKDLQEELLLHPKIQGLLLQLLRHRAKHSVWFESGHDCEQRMSITQFTRPLRRAMATEQLTLLEKRRQLPKEDTEPRNTLATQVRASQKQSTALRSVTAQLAARGIIMIGQLVASKGGRLFTDSTVPGRGTLHRANYNALATLITREVTNKTCRDLYTGTQTSLPSFFPPVEKDKANSASGSAVNWDLVQRRDGDHPPLPQHQDQHKANPLADRMQAVTQVLEDGLLVKCLFDQLLPDQNERVSVLDAEEAVLMIMMVTNHTTFTTDGENYWPGFPGTYKVRFDHYTRNHNHFTLQATMVDSPHKHEISHEIDGGFVLSGPLGVLSSLEQQLIGQAF